jgi:hypothetical protein
MLASTWETWQNEIVGGAGSELHRKIEFMMFGEELARLTWFTAGTMSADFNNNSRFSTEKFDTLSHGIDAFSTWSSYHSWYRLP